MKYFYTYHMRYKNEVAMDLFLNQQAVVPMRAYDSESIISSYCPALYFSSIVIFSL